MVNSENELFSAIQAADKKIAASLTLIKTLSKSLDKFNAVQTLSRQDYIVELLQSIRAWEPEWLRIFPDLEKIEHALESRLHALRATAHHDLVTGLSGRVAKPEHFKILSDNPLVLYLHPLTLEVSFESLKAVLSYARESLVSTSLDPDEIMQAHEAQLEIFRALRVDSKQFRKLFKTAYDMVLLKDGLPPESRVDIVELLQPLSWIWPSQALFKKNAGMPRFLLAYQIQKLRQDGLISAHNQRIDLGTATGGSTKNKNNVLYIPAGISEGQYYLSICFRQA